MVVAKSVSLKNDKSLWTCFSIQSPSWFLTVQKWITSSIHNTDNRGSNIKIATQNVVKQTNKQTDKQSNKLNKII